MNKKPYSELFLQILPGKNLMQKNKGINSLRSLIPKGGGLKTKARVLRTPVVFCLSAF